MTQAHHKLWKQLLNLHAIFARNSPQLITKLSIKIVFFLQKNFIQDILEDLLEYLEYFFANIEHIICFGYSKLIWKLYLTIVCNFCMYHNDFREFRALRNKNSLNIVVQDG